MLAECGGDGLAERDGDGLTECGDGLAQSVLETGWQSVVETVSMECQLLPCMWLEGLGRGKQQGIGTGRCLDGISPSCRQYRLPACQWARAAASGC